MCVKNRIVPGLDHLLNLKLFIIEYASQRENGNMYSTNYRNPNILRFEI